MINVHTMRASNANPFHCAVPVLPVLNSTLYSVLRFDYLLKKQAALAVLAETNCLAHVMIVNSFHLPAKAGNTFAAQAF